MRLKLMNATRDDHDLSRSYRMWKRLLVPWTTFFLF